MYKTKPTDEPSIEREKVGDRASVIHIPKHVLKQIDEEKTSGK